MASDAVHTLVGPLMGERYVTDVTIFTARGDIFPEHKRYISMVILKYLGGQIFFLRRKSRAVNTSSPPNTRICGVSTCI